MMIARSLLAALSVAALGSPASAEPTSPWARDGASALRLVDAGRGPAGERLAAVAITLEGGWKTYWRQPGDSGVPPRFDFSGSRNLASATVVFPVPERASDESGITNVYHHEVTLPVAVTPKDPAEPVELALVADYGVCDQVCVPVRSEVSLSLAADGGFPGPAAAAARRALAHAPKLKALGAPDGPLAIASIIREGNGFEIGVRAGAPGALLFAETGEGAFVPSPKALPPRADGVARFHVALPDGAPPAALRLTLSVGGQAIETLAPIDAVAAKP